jgi:hypothetical protein
MKPGISNITSEAVLNAFAVEPLNDRSTLERYLRKFPQYAVELAQLSHELSSTVEQQAELSKEDRVAIDQAWKQYSSSSAWAVAKMFENLSVPQLRDLAKFLDVPRQIVTAFRERKVIVSSIPQGFLSRLAERLNTNVEEIKLALVAITDISYVRSHKADEKPMPSAPATFEQLLIDAQVPPEKRAKLVSEGNQ